MDKQERKRVHHKAANGTIYVYEILESYWDKEKKQARNKQVCIGISLILKPVSSYHPKDSESMVLLL